MKHLPAFALLAVVPSLHAGTPPEPVQVRTVSPEISLTLDAGWRHDDFQWTIAGDRHGKHPNILSDLDWSDLEIVPVSLTAEVKLRDHWRAQLAGSYGWIVDGENRDSDYFLNNRKGEFSRSRADTRGRTVDAELALGYDLPEVARRVVFTPWLGVSYHQQHLNDRNGVQLVDTESGDFGPFPGLDSIYEAEWFGVVFGLDACVKLTEHTRFLFGARYELVTYEANADWNLRTDFDGFTHDARGDGWRLGAGVEWDFAPQWTLGLHASWSLFETDAGLDRTTFSDGSRIETRLNRVAWESVGVRLGVTHRF